MAKPLYLYPYPPTPHVRFVYTLLWVLLSVFQDATQVCSFQEACSTNTWECKRQEDAEERDDGGELEERKNYAIVEEKLKEEIRRNIFLKNQYEDLSIQVKFFQQIVDGLKNKK